MVTGIASAVLADSTLQWSSSELSHVRLGHGSEGCGLSRRTGLFLQKK